MYERQDLICFIFGQQHEMSDVFDMNNGAILL